MERGPDDGRELWKEDRTTAGWLTIIETLQGWDDTGLDYILAYRRGGGVYPSLYDGHMRVAAEFRTEGYAVHGDLLGTGRAQVIIYDAESAYVYSSRPDPLTPVIPGCPLRQPKRLSHSTLYPGGEIL
ncbi:hypothetical protein [Paenibacillus caseinilyticus]